MKKNKWFLLLLAIIFIMVNSDRNILQLEIVSALWGWSVWFYMFYLMMFTFNYISSYNMNRSTYFIWLINYALQLCFYFIYIYMYGYKKIQLDFSTTFLLIIIIVFEILTIFPLKSNHYLYSSIEDRLSTEEISDYVMFIMRRPKGSSLEKDKKMRLEITLLNVMSLIYCSTLPLFENALNEILDSSFIMLLILSITIFLHITLNYYKYKKSNIMMYRYIFDMFTSSFAIIYYALITEEMFVKIFLLAYLMVPILESTYKLLQIYQIGRQTLSYRNI